MQILHERYKPRLAILAFPCNQFGEQEPGSSDDILAVAAKYNVQFKIMAKVDIVGPRAIPLFKFLTRQITPTPLCDWNFTKILISPHAVDMLRFPSKIAPLEIEEAIKDFINK